MTVSNPLVAFFQRTAHWWGYLLTALLSFGLLCWAIGPVVWDPDHYYFANGGDGIQSYFATAYYALYDKGMRFTGMNYPYGEHISYPNLQPLVAVGINLLQRLGVPSGRYTIGITNELALLGVAAAPLPLYAVLRRFRLPVLYAVLTAVLIAYLSPQVMRLGGHNTLSYVILLPLLWYFIIRMQESPQQWRWYAWFVFVNVLAGGIMLYFAAAASFFLLGHVLVLALRREYPRAMLWRMAGAAVLALLVLRSWLWLSDHITDRPENPYGLLVYVASFDGVFTPPSGPLREFTAALWSEEVPPNEAQSYIGLVVSVVLAAALAGGLVAVVRTRKWRHLLWPEAVPAPLVTAIWAGVLLLIYACGYPMKWALFTWLTDHSGPLKQLRALGRFAWPSYYVAGVAGAYYLHLLWQRRQARWTRLAARLVVVLLLGGWAMEAAGYWQHKAEEISQTTGAEHFLDPNAALPQQLAWAHRSPDEFQAILPVPYYNIGSDKLDLSGSPNSIFNAEQLACTTGLPLLATYVSRPSVSQMLLHVQLLSSPLIPKALLNDFPSNKPLLLLVSPAAMTVAELHLIDLAKPIGLATSDYALYELPLAALAATTLAVERTKAAQLLPTLARLPSGIQTTTGKAVLVESYDRSPDRRSRLGTGGAFYAEPQQFSTLYDGPLPMPADTGAYEASVWINAQNKYGCGNMQIKIYDAQGQLLAHEKADGRVTTEVDGPWVRVAVPFRRKATATRMEILYESRDLLADDLLVRPQDTDVYYYVPQNGRQRLVKNAYLLDR